jgi:MoaA/NifB/PqqE/SkfB family radical SAM enzyme
MTDKPLVSIIINNYNYGRYLAEAIQSALDQSYSNTEIIVVDDGSTDNSRSIIRSYTKRYPNRIHPILKANGGQASAMNAGFAASKGDIICFLDSDDYWFGRKVESIVGLHKDYGFVQHNLLINGSRYRLLLNTGDLPLFLKEYGLIRSCVPTSAQSFRRDVLENLIPMPEAPMRLCADVWLRCGALYFTNAYSSDDCLGAYRVHGNNGWQDNMSKERPNIAAEIITLLNQHLGTKGLPPIPLHADSREQAFLKSIPILAGKTYILFGAGDLGVKLARRIRREGAFPICFIDSNSTLHGKIKDGLLILPPEALYKWRPLTDRIIVSVMQVERVYEQLTDMGYTYPKDILLPIDLEAHTSMSQFQISTPLSTSAQHADCQCPVCMQSFTTWKPFTRRIGQNQWREEPEGRLCPYCGSFERNRHFWIFLEQRGLLHNKPRVLHVAPEIGLMARLRAILGDRYTTIDLAMPHADKQADVTALPFEDDSYDFIYCSNVLEHVQDDRKAMSELARVLAPNGLAYIQVPQQGNATSEDFGITDPVRRTELYGQADHVRMYGSDIKARLAQAGFRVESLIMPDALNLPPEEQKRMNCSKREPVHLCYSTKGMNISRHNHCNNEPATTHKQDAPPILSITSDITNTCNSRCAICYLTQKKKKEQPVLTSLEQFRLIARKLHPYKGSLSLSCGFEPLINPDICAILSECKTLEGFSIRINSNGIAMTETVQQCLLESDISLIVISMDAVSPELNYIIRGNKKLDQIITNIRMFTAARKAKKKTHPEISIRMTLHKLNLPELPGLVNLAADLAVDKLEVQLMVPVKGATINEQPSESLFLDTSTTEAKAAFDEAKAIAKKRLLRLTLPTKPCTSAHEGWQKKKTTTAQGTGFHIQSDGTCRANVYNVDINGNCIEEYSGNILTDSIDDILNKSSRNRHGDGTTAF